FLSPCIWCRRRLKSTAPIYQQAKQSRSTSRIWHWIVFQSSDDSQWASRFGSIPQRARDSLYPSNFTAVYDGGRFANAYHGPLELHRLECANSATANIGIRSQFVDASHCTPDRQSGQIDRQGTTDRSIHCQRGRRCR